jgi:hypothetical protein
MTLNDLATADISVENHGSVVLLRAMTKHGAQWLHDHVHSEPWQWMGNAVAADPRFVQEIIGFAEEDGLKVAV